MLATLDSLKFKKDVIVESYSHPAMLEYYLKKNQEGFTLAEKTVIQQYLRQGGLCLDIGCGMGRIAIPLTEMDFKVIGVDLIPQMIEEAQREIDKREITLPLFVGDWVSLPFKKATFDNIISFDNLITYFDKEKRLKVFREIKRTLKKGGIFILCTSNNEFLFKFPYSFNLSKAISHFINPNSKRQNLFLLYLNILSVYIPSLIIDSKRSLLRNLLQSQYRGRAPKERPRNRFRMPQYLYWAKDVKEEIESCGLKVFDYSSEWELNFKEKLPQFWRSHAPLAYYFIQNPVDDIDKEKTKFEEAVLLFEENMVRNDFFGFQIATESMSPVLLPSDIIYAKKINVRELQEGDIVVFRSDEDFIAHRFLGFKDSALMITKGDLSPQLDAPVDVDRLVAKVIRLKTRGRTIDFTALRWQLTNQILAYNSRWQTHNAAKKTDNGSVDWLNLFCRTLNPDFAFLIKREKEFREDIEKKIIVGLCRETALDKPEELIKLIAQCRNWPKLLRTILYNSLGPVVYKNITALKLHGIPAWVTDQLKESYITSFTKTAPLYRDLRNLLKEFRGQNIEAIVLKGAAIAEKLYDDISLRPMEDIDILVKRGDWPKIRLVLEKLKYVNNEGLDLLELDRRSGVLMDRHLAYQNDQGAKLEFKFDLFVLDFPFPSKTDAYWENAREEDIAGEKALILCPEDQLLYLAARMTNTGFQYLLWFYDLKRFLDCHKNIDWQSVTDKALERKVVPAVYYTLEILRDTFGTTIPNEVREKLKPSKFKQKLFRFLFPAAQSGFRNPEKKGRGFDALIANVLLLDKFDLTLTGITRLTRYTRQVIFPPIDYITYRYKIAKWQACFGWAYLRRFFRFLTKIFAL